MISHIGKPPSNKLIADLLHVFFAENEIRQFYSIFTQAK